MIDIDSGFGCSKRAQEPGPNDQSHSLEAPPFLSAVCPYSFPCQDGRTPLMVVKTPEPAQALIAAGADVNLSDKVSSTCPIRRARSERRSRGEMANIAHSKPPLSCSLCRVPLLFPISGRQMSADGRLREAAFRNRSAPDCRRR